MKTTQKEKPLNILYAIFEAEPFIKTGGLGDVGGSLPAALLKEGVQVRIILPKLETIPREYQERMTKIAAFTVPLGWRNQYCGVEALVEKGVTCYFLDNEYYFKRPEAYGYGDDGERMAFFSKAILESLQHIPAFTPDILHCNDWHTALVPVFLREQYMHIPLYERIRTLFSVHNLKFQGIFSGHLLGDVLGLAHKKAAADQLAWGDGINYMKGGLSYSDRLTTVSPSYADEICTAWYGEHLEELFQRRRSVLSGILNGIDREKYAPEKDPYLFQNYKEDSAEEGKAANKKALQAQLGLEQRPDIPLVVIVSRLTEQKGLDLVLGILGELLCQDLQLAVLGVGDASYQDAFRYYESLMPGKVRACMTFDLSLASRFYAGADLLLMPSKFEPCGLSQMIAMGYGTIPVVRETGGLKDSIIPYNCFEHTGDGFGFANYNAHELLFTIKDALDLYKNQRDHWNHLVKRAMKKDFSWKQSARQYMALYKELAGRGRKQEDR